MHAPARRSTLARMSRAQAYWVSTIALMALGIATPLIAHSLGSACWIWLPAHWPALVAGLALGLRAGLLVGLATLVVELLGRPALAALPAATEILVYGIVSGLGGDRVQSFAGRCGGLLVAMLAGRLTYAVVALLVLARPLGVSIERVAFYPWPGVALQLVALPIVATLLARAVRRPLG